MYDVYDRTMEGSMQARGHVAKKIFLSFLHHSAPLIAIFEKGITIPLNSSPPLTPVCGPVLLPVEPRQLLIGVCVLFGSHASIVVPPQYDPINPMGTISSPLFSAMSASVVLTTTND